MQSLTVQLDLIKLSKIEFYDNLFKVFKLFGLHCGQTDVLQ